jgi:hypothetical protein
MMPRPAPHRAREARMPKDPERQHRLAGRLKESEARVGWLSDATLSDKLDGWLGRLLYPSNHPWGLVLIHADGTRLVLERRLPSWVLPAIILALGAGLLLFDYGDPGFRIMLGAIFSSFAGIYYVKQARTERYLLFDAMRRSAIVHRGHRVLVEIPFDDIDEILLEVRADASYGDDMRALASIGSASLPLTMWTTEDTATATAVAVAELVGLARKRKLRRLMPES